MCLIFMAHPAHAQSIRPGVDRLDAIVSYPLVIPVIAENERALRSGVLVRLDDGRSLQSQAFWIGITPQISPPSWTTAKGIWTATDYPTITKLPKAQRPMGAWFVEIPLPIDAVGQGIWIEGERYELNWLPDPQRARLEASEHSTEHVLSDLWDIKLSSQALNDPAVQLAIDQYNHNPFENWRARMLTDGLNPHYTPSSQSLDALDLELSLNTPGADLLGQLAHQNEARWQIILGRVWLIDPAVAHRLKSQLIRTAEFGDRTLPIWTSDDNELARLAHDLLSPFVDDQIRVLRAKAWLEKQPRALAWITDDQGRIEADTNRFIPTITALSLPQSEGSSLFRLDSAAANSSPELATIPPNQTSPLLVTVDPVTLSPTNLTLETASVQIRTGRWSSTLEVIASPTPARAPYVRIGPLLKDWTMGSLLNNQPMQDANTARRRTAMGIFRKTSTPSRTHPTTGWQLYIELTTPEPLSTNESLTLWIGPYANAAAVWMITPEGTVTILAENRASIGLPTVRTRILDDRWVAMIDLPRGVFDQDHILQLGLERTDEQGTHTAWPRRMMPGQPEPGRLSIQADKFDQLKP